MRDKPLLLMQAGDAPEFILRTCGNFDALFVRAAALAGSKFEIVNIARGETPGPHARYDSVLVTGSHSMVTDREAWSESAAVWLAGAVETGLPVFGVCYGHQLLAHALGGEVGYHPRGMELGTFDVFLTDAGRGDPFLAETPRRFTANLSHSQTILRLPSGAASLGFSDHDPHQIVRYSPTALSVQFHPEFGEKEMRSYLDFNRLGNPASARAQNTLPASDTPWAKSLLTRFVGRP